MKVDIYLWGISNTIFKAYFLINTVKKDTAYISANGLLQKVILHQHLHTVYCNYPRKLYK